MNRLRRPRVFVLLLALAATVAVGTGCGIKRPPLPPDQLVPGPVADLAHRFVEPGLVEITFRPPQTTVTGRELTNLTGFYVFRSRNALRPDFCPGCPVDYKRVLDVPAQPPPPDQNVADVPYTIEDRLDPGYVYHYRVAAHDARDRHDPDGGRTLILHYDHPPRPPEQIETATEDRVVFLSWTPPERLVNGELLTDLAGYEVYRRAPGEDWRKINRARPVDRPMYRDQSVANQVDYRYRVASVRKVGPTLVPGPRSAEVSARPVDLTAPPAPAKVFAASQEEGVKLTWPAVEAEDLGGYRVYRMREGQDEYRRIGPKILTDNLFLDDSVRPGVVYYYRVTAVDRSPQANESEPSRPGRVLHAR
jgi:hypothetical protein